MKLGDIVRNEWAGQRNPQKVLMFIRRTGRTIYCLALDGREVQFYNDKVLRLTKIGTLDLDTWRQLAAQEVKDDMAVPTENRV